MCVQCFTLAHSLRITRYSTVQNSFLGHCALIGLQLRWATVSRDFRDAEERVWPSVCTSIHTHTHTSIRAHITQTTAPFCSILDLSSYFKLHKYITYVFSAQKINLPKKKPLIRGISSSGFSRWLADGCVRAWCLCTRAHNTKKYLATYVHPIV